MTGGKPLAPWSVVARREVLAAPPRLWVAAETVRLPDGRLVEDFWQVTLPSYVVIAAETPDGGLVIERQYKHGPRRVSLTLPAGHLEPGEDPLAAAQRELLEETGCIARDWRPMGSFCGGGNAGLGQMHAFRCRDTRQVQPPASGDLEEMEILRLSRAQLIAAWQAGDFAIVGSACALALWFAAELTG